MKAKFSTRGYTRASEEGEGERKVPRSGGSQPLPEEGSQTKIKEGARFRGAVSHGDPSLALLESPRKGSGPHMRRLDPTNQASSLAKIAVSEFGHKAAGSLSALVLVKGRISKAQCGLKA